MLNEYRNINGFSDVKEFCLKEGQIFEIKKDDFFFRKGEVSRFKGSCFFHRNNAGNPKPYSQKNKAFLMQIIVAIKEFFAQLS